MTPAERKAAERQRRRNAGLVPIEVWVPLARKAELVAEIAALIQRMKWSASDVPD